MTEPATNRQTCPKMDERNQELHEAHEKGESPFVPSVCSVVNHLRRNR